jgi:hypothetical protein
VDALRHELGLPGMKVVQFGFGDKGAHIHLPHRYTPDTVAYTGTHDNNTTLGWWQAAGKAERAAIEAYVGPVGKQPVWPLIWAIEVSVAQMAVVPAQDLLRCRWQLELARSGGKLVAGAGRSPGRVVRGYRPRQRPARQRREIGNRTEGGGGFNPRIRPTEATVALAMGLSFMLPREQGPRLKAPQFSRCIQGPEGPCSFLW